MKMSTFNTQNILFTITLVSTFPYFMQYFYMSQTCMVQNNRSSSMLPDCFFGLFLEFTNKIILGLFVLRKMTGIQTVFTKSRMKFPSPNISLKSKADVRKSILCAFYSSFTIRHALRQHAIYMHDVLLMVCNVYDAYYD